MGEGLNFSNRTMNAGTAGNFVQPTLDIDRKRRIARITPLISIGIWLMFAILHLICRILGVSELPYSIASRCYLAVALLILAHYLYFKTPLCLRIPIKFKTFGMLSVLMQGIIALIYFSADHFSYFSILAITLSTPAGPAFLGLTYGFTGTCLGGLVLLPILVVGYVLVNHGSLTVPAPMFALFMFAWGVAWIIGAIVNENNLKKKYLIFDLFKKQMEYNALIKKQNSHLDEKTQQLEAANQTLRHMSMVDGLTHVANRRRFDETFTEEWNRAVRNHVAVAQHLDQNRLDVLSIILLDIDYFKQYNDTYGHLAGDECLRQVAQAIESCLNRSSDLVARYGGEEFVVLLPATYPEGAVNVAENIRLSIQNLQIKHATSPISSFVSASLGVAGMHVDLDHNNASSLLKRADQALYEAKRRGRNRVIFWNQEHHLADAPTRHIG